MATLTVLEGPDKGLTFRLQGPVARIGRGHGVSIQLFDHTVSRRHCRIVLRDGAHWVRVEGPTNPLRVNGEPVGERCLREGDAIMVGETVLRFSSD